MLDDFGGGQSAPYPANLLPRQPNPRGCRLRRRPNRIDVDGAPSKKPRVHRDIRGLDRLEKIHERSAKNDVIFCAVTKAGTLTAPFDSTYMPAVPHLHRSQCLGDALARRSADVAARGEEVPIGDRRRHAVDDFARLPVLQIGVPAERHQAFAVDVLAAPQDRVVCSPPGPVAKVRS